jgi:hypothetical protein
MNNIIQITFPQLFISTSIVTILVIIVQFLLSNWIKSRLEKSIEHEYSKKIEDYRFSILQREQASKIASLLAKWAKYSAKEKTILKEKELYDYYEELTRLSYEISLWINDEELVKKIMVRLENKEGAPQNKELLIKIREHILGKKTKQLKAENIIHWFVK